MTTAGTKDVAVERAGAIEAAVDRIRGIERDAGIDHDSLGRIKAELLDLAARKDLFTLDTFPPPGPDAKRRSCLYRVSEDDDHRFALYVNSANTQETPAHNHTTWAVIAGIHGEEHNRFYRRLDGNEGVEQTGSSVVTEGNGVAFLAEELHSIHIDSERPILNFHMYGLGLEQLDRREYFSETDREWRVFPPHSDIREGRYGRVGSDWPVVSPQELKALLRGSEEIALLDVREQGTYFHEHLLFACCAPFSRLEVLIADLVPRHAAPVVLCDGGDGQLASRAAERLRTLGYSRVSILKGGIAGWRKAGLELFSGINVPSKAFGEYVEHRYGTPHISAADLTGKLERNENLVILDSRPLPEFTNMSLPGGIDCPGAELAWRMLEVAPDPDTLVVVNCAGRTRSIIGAQSLINAGVPNRVVALENGTMGWKLAGFEVRRGGTEHAPDPSTEAAARAQAAAAEVAQQHGVREIDAATLAEWKAETDTRTLYVLDVRTPAEYEAGHWPGSRSTPGGQLVQATDEYIATRNARVVLLDNAQVRANMTASWLRQMGWDDVFVLFPPLSALTEKGSHGLAALAQDSAQTLSAVELQAMLDEDSVRVLDIATSLQYRRGHIPGASWGMRTRLDRALTQLGPVDHVVLTAPQESIAHFVAEDVHLLSPSIRVSVLAGGTPAWVEAGLVLEEGDQNLTCETDDVWYKPYEHNQAVEEAMRDYLTWEIGLVAQIERDGDARFR